MILDWKQFNNDNWDDFVHWQVFKNWAVLVPQVTLNGNMGPNPFIDVSTDGNSNITAMNVNGNKVAFNAGGNDDARIKALEDKVNYLQKEIDTANSILAQVTAFQFNNNHLQLVSANDSKGDGNIFITLIDSKNKTTSYSITAKPFNV